MVKALTFKGDKKPKKRKRVEGESSRNTEDRELKVAKAEADEESDDSWVSADTIADVAGPVMFVLPTVPPMALASDAHGKVFTLPIENIVDGNPQSAEPHDVRQVWVANKIAGTENFRFKGHHEKYLGCDKFGILMATSEAVSPLESFVLTATPDNPGTFQLQTQRDTYLTIMEHPSSKAKSPPDVRGDATESSSDTIWRIRMQARYKPRFKANKEEKAREKISRKELEEAVGRKLEEHEIKTLKRARKEGDYHEKLLDMRVKGKHDKFG